MNKAVSVSLVLLVMWISSAVFDTAQAVPGRPVALDETSSQRDGELQSTQEQATATIETTAAPVESPTEPATQAVEPSATPPPAELVVLKIEPDRISRESGGTLSIYGSGFGPGIAVRLVGYGLLDAAVLNPTAIRAVVPPGLSEGRYGVEVIQSNGNSVRLGNALRIRSSLPEPTDTPEPGPLLAYYQPELVIQSVETDPDAIHSKGTFTLRLDLINRGDYTATNVRLTLASAEIAIPKEGSNLVVLDKLDPDQVETVQLSLVLSEAAPAGYNSLPITVQYSDYYQREYISEQSIGLNVSDSASGQPLVLLSSYETQPEALSPGEAFILRLQLSNVGDNSARQLLVTLGGNEGNDTRPFAILGSGNVRFIQALDAGDNIDLEMRVMLAGSAESGVYNLPVSLEYESEESAERLVESQILNLLVSRRPNLRIDYYLKPETGQVGQPLELPIEVVNIGRELVNVSTIQVSGEGLKVEDGEAFIGALDAGTSGSLDAGVVPERSGTLSAIVTVNYLDDFNQPQTITQPLSVQVTQPEPTPQGPDAGSDESGSGLWPRILRFFRGLIGLGS
ncbi:MAG TPA: IPT/TIG domain-containing protein [Anaerolineales bacterium]